MSSPHSEESASSLPREPIAADDWIWHGKPGHFICAYSCCFRLHTTVGKYRISTVGCYHPAGEPGPDPHTIGLDRLYETMVFENGPDGEPAEWSGELECVPYQTDEAAEEGHYDICCKYAALGDRAPAIR